MAKRRRKEYRRQDELVCSRCNVSLDELQVFCYECGEPTGALRSGLSARQTIKKVWEEHNEVKSKSYTFAIFYFFVLLVPLAVIIALTVHNYYLHNLSLLIFLPLLFIPFAMAGDISGRFTIKGYFNNIKFYPRYFIFILINILYFFIVKVITDSVDPMLNIVRLILVLYWLAIVTPLPSLIGNSKIPFLKALKDIYRGSKETRWQQFFLLVFGALINIAGLALIGLGLLVTVPFTFKFIDAYYRQMLKYKLLN